MALWRFLSHRNWLPFFEMVVNTCDFITNVGNNCDLGTVGLKFLSHRYFLHFLEGSKYLWLQNWCVTVPKSQKFPIFCKKSPKHSKKSFRNSCKYLWLRNFCVTVPMSQILPIFLVIWLFMKILYVCYRILRNRYLLTFVKGGKFLWLLHFSSLWIEATVICNIFPFSII